MLAGVAVKDEGLGRGKALLSGGVRVMLVCLSFFDWLSWGRLRGDGNSKERNRERDSKKQCEANFAPHKPRVALRCPSSH